MNYLIGYLIVGQFLVFCMCAILYISKNEPEFLQFTKDDAGKYKDAAKEIYDIINFTTPIGFYLIVSIFWGVLILIKVKR